MGVAGSAMWCHIPPPRPLQSIYLFLTSRVSKYLHGLYPALETLHILIHLMLTTTQERDATIAIPVYRAGWEA